VNALEAAVQIKKKMGGVVTAISMGPKQTEETLRDALARGADKAVLLTDTRFASLPCMFITSYLKYSSNLVGLMIFSDKFLF